MTRNRIFTVLLCAAAVSACSNKFIIKPGDTLDVAYNKAAGLYEKKRWAEAAAAFETVLSMGRGTATAEQAQFLLAESYNRNGETLLAASEYERYYTNYPKSDRAVEAQYKEALCFYDLSPRYKLDQQDTEKAMDKFQLFLANNPETNHADSVVVMLDDLRNKLSRKYYESGKLYMKLKQYHAAAIYFGMTMDRYPESKFAEPSLAQQIHAYLLFAVNSVQEKQEERFNKAIASYEKYVQIFPDGKSRSQVEKWFDDARAELARLKKDKEAAASGGIFTD